MKTINFVLAITFFLITGCGGEQQTSDDLITKAIQRKN